MLRVDHLHQFAQIPHLATELLVPLFQLLLLVKQAPNLSINVQILLELINHS